MHAAAKPVAANGLLGDGERVVDFNAGEVAQTLC
jgi:hypothetical protein